MFIKKLLTAEKINILLFFLSWRIWTLAFAAFGIVFLPLYGKDFFGGGLENYFERPLVWGWLNFDGEHYLAIVQRGYEPLTHAFFPLYPLLIRILSFNHPALFVPLGLLLTNCFFFLSLVFLKKLIKLDYSLNIQTYSLLTLIVFPTSFFMGAFYTESLFLLSSVLCFLCARRAKWFAAGVFGALAASTRIFGILLLPALLVEWATQKRGKLSTRPIDLVDIIYICITALGLVGYMYFLYKTSNNPFSFYTEQKYFSQDRTTTQLIILPQVFWRYLKMLATVDTRSHLYLTITFEFLSSLIVIALLIFGYLSKVRPSYLLFAFLGLIIPSLTGTFTSFPRYILSLFPIFIVLGLFLNKTTPTARIIFITISAALSLVQITLFIRGYWIG